MGLSFESDSTSFIYLGEAGGNQHFPHLSVCMTGVELVPAAVVIKVNQ